jgi:hypothetical protein
MLILGAVYKKFNMNTTNTYSRMALRVFAILLTGLLTTQLMVAQDWYDTDWPFRSVVAVSNPGSTELSDFQVKITLTSSNFNFTPTLADGSDIRVTSSDGTTFIPFWLESWDKTGSQGTIWVKMPTIPVSGTSVYIYYGNAAPTIPPQVPVVTPPIGPFAKYSGNPITVSGLSCSDNVLPENLVYDGGKYWIIISNRCTTPCPLSLISSTDLITWVHEGVILSASDRYFDAPCLVQADNTWYIFYSNYDGSWSESNPAPIGIAKSTTGNIMGPYTELNRYILTCGNAGTWDDARVSEPYVIQRDNGDWVMVYMGDAEPAGGFVEQVGIAVSTTGIEGPYTKSLGNPVIPFGATGALDAGTVADPWVVKFGSTFYIGYTASPSKSNWNTTYASTTDWSTFTKSNTVILNQGPGAYDQSSAFRGAVTRIGDNYLFPYTAQGSGGFQFAYATQPVNVTPPSLVNNVYGVFEFYDGFDSTALNTTKWSIFRQAAQTGTATVSEGSLTLRANSGDVDVITITGNKSFGPGMLLESFARHPDANGVGNTAAELGFANQARDNNLRILDYSSTTNFIMMAMANNLGERYDNLMTCPLNSTDYLLHSIFWRSSSQVDFALGNYPFQSLTSIIPSVALPPWLMSVGIGNQARLLVDWIRVRKWVGTDAGATVSYPGQGLFIWDGSESTAWGTGDNWAGNTTPGSGDNISIPDVTNDPVFSGNLMVDPAGSMTIQAGAALTVNGNMTTNNGLYIESSVSTGSGSLIVSGTSTGNVTYSRFLRPESSSGDKHFFSSPVSGQTISGFTAVNGSRINVLNSQYEIWEWNELAGAWQIVSSSGSFASGKGYNIDQATGSDGLLKFTGTVVNSATFTATSPYITGYTARSSLYEYGDGNLNSIWSGTRTWLNYGGGGWNLLGNPFTSAMDAAAFLTSNTPPVSAINKFDPNYQALYVYDGVNSVYKYAAASAPLDPVGAGSHGSYIQAGQGFFVLAIYDGIVYNFNQNMQVHNTAVTMLKSAEVEEPWPGLELKVKYGSRESLTTLVYNDEMTTGLDPGYDVGQFSAGPDVEIYTTLVLKDNSVNFARQALPLTDYDKNIIPVGIDSEKGGEVTFSAYTVPLGDNKFWLEDRTAGTFTNLNTNTYTVTLPAKTYGTGRFFIIASANTPTGIKLLAEDTGVRVWISNDKVIIKGEVSERAICTVYDLHGQKIVETHLNDGELNTVTLSSGLHGVYLVRVVDGVKVTTRKVAVL